MNVNLIQNCVIAGQDLHLGELIKEKLKENGSSVSWVAKQLNRDRTNMYKIFQNPHINTLLLLQLSFILNYNFFIHCSDFFKKNKQE